MSNSVADIQLTVEQEESIVNLVDKLQESAFGKSKSSNNPDDQPKLHLMEWMMYLMEVAIEGADVRSKKKGRTTTKRRTHLRKIKKLLGHYPTDADVQNLFSKEANQQSELIALLQADVRQLEEYAPVKKTELDKLRERLIKLQDRLRTKGKKTR